MNRLYELILFNYRIKQLFVRIFFSSFVQNNFLYNKVLQARIDKVAALYHNKPYCLRIENTNICNARCIMCPRDLMEREQGIMGTELYEKVIDSAVELGIEYVNLHNFGEPLLDPNFVEKVAYAKKRGIKTVSTNSNASVLTEEVGRRLIEANIDKLFFSIDAAEAESYEEVRVGLKYDSLVENIKRVVELRKELKRETPEIVVNFVVVEENKNEVEQFIKNWKGVADNVSISFSHDWGGDKKELDIKADFLSPCRLLWTELTVAWNGDYLLCCQDYDGKVVLGNAREKSIAEVWQDKELRHYRATQLNEGRAGLPLCSSCKLNTFWWF